MWLAAGSRWGLGDTDWGARAADLLLTVPAAEEPSERASRTKVFGILDP